MRDYRSIIEAHLLPAFGAERIEDITQQMIEEWRTSFGLALAARTKNKWLVVLHGVFRRAQTVWGLPVNPVTGIEKYRQRSSGDIDVFSPEEVLALVRAAGDDQDAAAATPRRWAPDLRQRPAFVARRATLRYMSQPVSLRLPASTVERLGGQAARVQLAPRTLAQRYVEEGLRMDEHPLVRFVHGPAGRRARLVGTGSDVWEVIAAVKDNEGDIAETADHLHLALGIVQAAVAYYGAFVDEIDEWINRNEHEATQAHDAWLAGQAALQR